MVFSLNLSRARQKRHLGDRLPITHREGAQLVVGIGWLLIGGVFTALAIFFFGTVSINSDPTPIPAYLLLGVFLIFGFTVMAVGLSAFLHKVDLMIDAEGVRGLQRNIKGTRTWNEPLTTYSGVLGEEEYHSGGKHHSAYTLYKVVLKHSDEEDHDVLLYSSRSGEQHRNEIEMFARLLNRPVLMEESGGRYAERAVEDLDKSVKELVEEGKLDARFNPYNQPKGDKLTLEKEGKGYVFTHHYRGIGRFLFSFLFLGAGLGMLYWYFGPGVPASAGGSPWVAAALGVVFTLLGGYMVVFCALANSTLRVFPDELQSYTDILGWCVSDKRAASTDVEEVTVAKNKQGRLELQVSGDRGSLSFGKQVLNEDELQFVRSAIIATLSRRR